MQKANKWLENAALLVLDRVFKEPGLLDTVNLSYALPTRGAFSENPVIGQTVWGEEGTVTVSVSPTRFHEDNYVEILGTLIHEIIHVKLGKEEKHGAEFRKMMAKVGLEGKATNTVVSGDLRLRLNGWKTEIGEVPSAPITAGQKPQSTRLLKLICGCQEPRILRVSNKVYNSGDISCGECGKMFDLEEEV